MCVLVSGSAVFAVWLTAYGVTVYRFLFFLTGGPLNYSLIKASKVRASRRAKIMPWARCVVIDSWRVFALLSAHVCLSANTI